MQLETPPSDLLFSPDEHERAWELFADFARRYLAGIADRAAYPELDRRALRTIMQTPMPRSGASLVELLEEFEAVIAPNATHSAHLCFLPYVQRNPAA